MLVDVQLCLLKRHLSPANRAPGPMDEEAGGTHHDLAGGSSGVLHRHRVVEDQRPEQPHRLPYGELGSTRP